MYIFMMDDLMKMDLIEKIETKMEYYEKRNLIQDMINKEGIDIDEKIVIHNGKPAFLFQFNLDNLNKKNMDYLIKVVDKCKFNL